MTQREERKAAARVLTMDDIELPKVEIGLASNATNMVVYIDVPFYTQAFHRKCVPPGAKTFRGVVKVKVACAVCGRTIARRRPA